MEWAKGKSACSFWGAQRVQFIKTIKGDMPFNGCECRDRGRTELSRECIIPGDFGTFYFSPPLMLEKDPHVQLWDRKCKCVKAYEHDVDSPMLSEQIQGVAAVDFCRNLFAAADRANSNHYPKYWVVKWKADMQKRVNETLSMHRCQKQLSDTKKIEDLLESKGSLTLKQAWKKVCYDECEDLLDELRETMETVVETGRLRKNSWSEICAEHVVKKVESHLLGCCGRSCGWNGRTCASSDGLYKMDLISQELLE